MHEVILSVGIDIGTSTTQLVFSELTIENQATSYTVPRISIVDKKVIFRSEIFFTPLLSQTEIDGEAVKQILESQYQKAGMKPEDVKTGAVIITGETARKENANVVLETLSGLAGDFVVATAGPDLESVLSGRGAGADTFSKEKRCVVANVDVGGGTSNIAVFDHGSLIGTTCLDIGGRLIKVDRETKRITYIYSKIQKLAMNEGIPISVGDIADTAKIRRICTLMADLIGQSLHIQPKSVYYNEIFTNGGKGLKEEIIPTAVTFSGGVADYIYQEADSDLFRYGDIGIILGQEIRKHCFLQQLELYQAVETIRATVVGAGTHTTEISGSTISYEKNQLPMKNIPILKISEEEEKTCMGIEESIRRQIPLYISEGEAVQIAISFEGTGYSGFAGIQELAQAIINGAKVLIRLKYPLLIVAEHDIAKALGHALNVKLKHSKEVICIDGIRTQSGDYIDIGEPIGEGRVVPVVIKTLIFNS